MPGWVLDSEDPDNANPPRAIFTGQEIQVRSQRADLDTRLASDEAAQLQVQLRPRIAIATNVAALAGLGTIQAVALADADMVLLWGQSDTTQNGPWVVHANIAGVAQNWTRPAVPFGHGAQAFVLAGTYAGQVLQNTNVATLVYGTSHITFTQSGNVANATGILPLAHGGTGADLSSGTANATTVLLTNDVATGGTAKAFALNNTVDLVTAGAKIIDFQSAGTSKAAVLGDGGLLTPTVGPNSTQRHTLPAVASGTVIVSGASSIPDATLQVGDGTHRLTGVAAETITSGDVTLTLQSSVANVASAVGVAVRNAINLLAGGASVMTIGSGTALLYIGAASGAVDALCFAESITCSGTVTAGQVVVWSGTKQVAAAGASAGLTTIAGVALTGGTNATIIVARHGRAYTNCDAGITAGQLLKTSGAVAGNVVSSAAAFGTVVGRACEASGATTAGQVLMDITLS